MTAVSAALDRHRRQAYGRFRWSSGDHIDGYRGWTHNLAMLRRYVDHLRQPKQLLALPFRLVGMAAAGYVLVSGRTRHATNVAFVLIFSMLAITLAIDVAWWATHRRQASR